jgi:hypothetical protein
MNNYNFDTYQSINLHFFTVKKVLTSSSFVIYIYYDALDPYVFFRSLVT